MDTRHDINDRSDVELLVNTFYTQVRADELIGPIFENVIGNNWAPHLDKMYRFWETLLLYNHTYSGSPFPPHQKLPIEKEHFDRWMQLFIREVDRLFKGERADEAKWRAQKMADLFHFKIGYYRDNPNTSLI
jgi:hemoglobin